MAEMTSSEKFVYDALKKIGRLLAQDLQNRSATMTATQIIDEEDYLPMFNPEKQYLNYTAGYCCKDSEGHRWKLIQPYDSTIYTQQPSELPAQWGILHTTNYLKSDDFVSISTSPYAKDECCIVEVDGIKYIFRSAIDNNVWAPSDVIALQEGGQLYWYCLGKAEELLSEGVQPVEGQTVIPTDNSAE